MGNSCCGMESEDFDARRNTKRSLQTNMKATHRDRYWSLRDGDEDNQKEESDDSEDDSTNDLELKALSIDIVDILTQI